MHCLAMVIVKEQDIGRANAIARKYNCHLTYSILSTGGCRYAVYDKGPTIALLEIDMQMGLTYKEGRIIQRD